MAAVNPQGQEKYWYDGRPSVWLKNNSLNEGSLKYWVDGRPCTGLIPESLSSVILTRKQRKFRAGTRTIDTGGN